MNTENLSRFLAPREKKLRYFQATFAGHSLDADQAREIQELLSTFALLIAKVVKAKTDPEREEAKGRLLATEARLTSLFELRRLSTGELAPSSPTATIVLKGESLTD